MGSFEPVSMKQGDSIAAYRIVRASSADTVAVCTATTDLPFGVTTDNSNSTVHGVPVQVKGICRVQFNDSVVAGGLVATDAVGRGIPYVALSTGNYSVGVLIGPKVNATGAIAQILLQPMWRASLL